jgi:exodeoxyribonuclease VIII
MIKKMSDEEYFALDRINQSSIKDILKMSPWEYVHKIAEPKKETDSMKLGTAVHCLSLEKEDFWNRYALFKPVLEKDYKNPKASKEYKDQHKKFLEENQSKIIIDDDFYSKAKEMSDRIEKSGYISNPKALRENVILQNTFGHDCKIKVDYLDVENKLFIDLKTTSDSLDDDSLMRHILQWGFNLQASFYNESIKEQFGEYFDIVFLVVRSIAPYDIRPIVISPEADAEFLELGRTQIIKGLEKLEKCNREGIWEDNSQNPFYLKNIPAWYRKKIEGEDG